MSSVLKALKKLEEESVHQKMMYPGSSGRGKDIMVKRSRFVWTWPYKAFLTLCFLMVFLVIGRWFMMSKAPVSIQQIREKSVLPQQKKTIDVSKSDQVKNAIIPPSNTIAKDLLTEKDLTQTLPDTSQQMTNENPVLPSAFTQETPLMPPSDKSTAPETNEPSPAAYASIKERSYDPRIKLQAIAWSSDQEKRMAVINNQIVHEGSSIDGISVIQILEDQVIFREGETSFKITFGSK